MSLGPPFDDSGLRTQQAVGAGTTVLLLAAVGIALLASDRTLGETFSLRVRLRSPGALHSGAQVRLAGEQIGEIVAIRPLFFGQGASLLPSPPEDPMSSNLGTPRVEVEARLLLSAKPRVARNASFFVHSPNVLTESVLEIGPPLWNAAPIESVQGGDVVRGTDPPEIDQLMTRVHQSVSVVLRVANELRPAWEDCASALSSLFDTIDGLADGDQTARILGQGRRLAKASARVETSLAQSQALLRGQRLAGELRRTAQTLGPELSRAGETLATVEERARGLAMIFGTAEQERLLAGVANFRAAIANFERLVTLAQALAAMVERGEGTIGGLAQDRQIYDEFKETHRILKRESWRLLIKPTNKGRPAR